MNNKGFSLVDLLGSLMLLMLILGIGLYSARGTLATSLLMVDQIKENEIKDAAKLYVLEYSTSWINDGEEYACLAVKDLVDVGYFEFDEVKANINNEIKIVREPKTKVINTVEIMDVCR